MFLFSVGKRKKSSAETAMADPWIGKYGWSNHVVAINLTTLTISNKNTKTHGQYFAVKDQVLLLSYLLI